MAKTRSQRAYLYCMQTNFENFLRSQDILVSEWTETKSVLKKTLKIDSLSELDDELNSDLINRFESLIQKYHQYYFSSDSGYPPP